MGGKPTPSSRPKSAPASSQRVRGKGSYILPGTLELAGRRIGEKAGGWLGGNAGALLSSISGVGDYQVNNIMHADKALTSAMPRVYEFTNTELVQVVTSPGSTFTAYTYANNPGLGNFPWLSSIAQRFNKYRFKQLVYHFESTCSEYASGSALGTVAIATNYDASDRAFVSMVEMEATENAVSGKPSVDKLHGVECATADNPFKWYYVRPSSPAAGTDIRLYDMSDTTLAVEGLSAPSGTVIGRLKVFYTVEFCSPIALGIPPAYLPSSITAREWGTNSSTTAGAGPYWGVPDNGTSAPTYGTGLFQSLPITVGGGTGGSSGVTTYPVVDVTGNKLTFYARGVYFIFARWYFGVVPSATTLSFATVNCSVGSGYSSVGTLLSDNSNDKNLLVNEGYVVVNAASTASPATVTITPSGSWGSTFTATSSRVCVTYIGQQ